MEWQEPDLVSHLKESGGTWQSLWNNSFQDTKDSYLWESKNQQSIWLPTSLPREFPGHSTERGPWNSSQTPWVEETKQKVQRNWGRHRVPEGRGGFKEKQLQKTVKRAAEGWSAHTCGELPGPGKNALTGSEGRIHSIHTGLSTVSSLQPECTPHKPQSLRQSLASEWGMITPRVNIAPIPP